MPNVIFDSTQGLDFEWDYPDPPEISYRFLRLQHAFEDTLILTEQLAEIAREDIQQHFLTETDPQGKAWEPLVEPAENQVGILRLSEDMYHAAVQNAIVSDERHVYFEADVLPPYWVYHEQPGGGSQRIPRRSFIGLSSAAKFDMEVAAANWLNNVIDYVYEEPMVRVGMGHYVSAGEVTGYHAGGIQLGSRGFIQVGRYKGKFVKIK